MNRLYLLVIVLAVLAISCGQSSEQIGTRIPPTEGPTEITQSDATVVPTNTLSPTETPLPTATPTPMIEGLVEPGMYRVGIDDGQIAPGIYMGNGTSCYWERLSGLGGTFDDIIANAGPEGQFYVEIKDTDMAFSLDRCSILPLDRVPAPTEPLIPIEPGMYLIGRDIEAGIYHGNGDSCYWERLRGLGGTFDDIIANDGPEGQFYLEVLDSDLALNLNRCSILPFDQLPAQTAFLTHLEPGMYLVGRDIEAGLYQGTGESCYWERLRNVAGEFDGIIANDGPEGSFFVEISPTDFAFRINRCSLDLSE